MKELKEMCENIAKELIRRYEGNPAEDEAAETAAYNEDFDLYSYFTNALDVEYIISTRGEYLGAHIAVTLGGPNIYIDTRRGYVTGYWDTDHAEAWLPREVCDEIDDIFEAYYESISHAE